MLDIFLFAFNGVAPIVLLIILGYYLRQINLMDDRFLKAADHLVFQVFLPTLLFLDVYSIKSLKSIDWATVFYAVAVIFLLFVLGLFTAAFIKVNAQKGVILQCVFRSNFAIIGIPLAEAFAGKEGAAIAAILSAFSIPLYNIFSVIALSIYSDDHAKINWKDIIVKILKNPLIRAISLALTILVIRSFIPVDGTGELLFSLPKNVPFLYSFIQSVAKIASPLALIVLGGKFSFEAAHNMLKEIVLGTVWRIVLAPAIGIAGAVFLTKMNLAHFGSAQYVCYITLFGTPVAVSSAIMANEMGSDGQLAGQLVVWTSIGSMVTIFLFIVLSKIMGLL